MLKLVREEINLYLNKYESTDGKSLDYYCKDKQLHPMATSKYILTLCSLYRSKLISKAHLITKTKKPISQLYAMKIKLNNDKFFGGLNFEWNNLQKNEKYLITSAIVVQSLCELSTLLDDEDINKFANVSLSSLEHWLCNRRVKCDNFADGIPMYSDSLCESVYNPGAYAYSVALKYSRNREVRSQGSQFLKKIFMMQIVGVGWKYSQDNNIIDLLHNCYIANACLSFPKLVNDKNIFNILSMINQFNNGTYFLDSCVLKHNIAEWTGGSFRYIDKNSFIEFKSSKARMWSMGELLVLLSLILKSTENNNIHSFSRKMLLVALEMSYKEKNYFRHTMHYAHGLASLLEVIRKK